MPTQQLKLENRAALRLSGKDVREFLQGLITSDITDVAPSQALYAALLTPQGKYLFDMIIVADGDDLLLDIEAERKPQLMQRLTMYKLRADVTITEEDTSVWVLWPDAENAEVAAGISYTDPRHKALKIRVISKNMPCPDAERLPYTIYEERRIRHGVPDGSRDMCAEKYFWLETGAEKLNGVSFTKGCYVGQELTARMKHRTDLKKMLIPVKLSGPAQTGDLISNTEGKNAGEIRTVANGYALAYLRLAFKDDTLLVNGHTLGIHLSSD